VIGQWVKGKFAAAGLCLLISGTVAGLVAYRSHLRKLDVRYGRSCANHFGFYRLGLAAATAERPGVILPSTDDTRAALSSLLETSLPTNWIWDYGSACPESYLRDRSIGYLYVGDGLRLGDVEEKEILILFCPAENHRGADGRANALAHSWNYPPGIRGNDRMIAELERAIARGESGEVAYSERAMKVLRSELEKRRKPVK
jgi:hypothetical protein